MTTAPFRTRLEALIAADRRHAVIVRRGPKRHYRLIAWNLDTDVLEPGQWMKGLVEPTDLSPDGRFLIYRAAQYHAPPLSVRLRAASPFDPMRAPLGLKTRTPRRARRRLPRYLRDAVPRSISKMRLGETWTAISRPPWFSALALWPSFGRWTGGGVFVHADRVQLWESPDGMTAIEHVPIPPDMSFEPALTNPPECRTFKPRSARSASLDMTATERALVAALGEAGFEDVQWAIEALPPDLIFAAGGRLYRLPGFAALEPDRWGEQARLIGDFRDMRFEAITPPPEALRW